VFGEGQRVKVKNPEGPGWIPAEFREVTERQGDEPDQAWVVYQEGALEGTTGLHPIIGGIVPEGYDFDSDPPE
jgi:hypothetical protein